MSSIRTSINVQQLTRAHRRVKMVMEPLTQSEEAESESSEQEDQTVIIQDETEKLLKLNETGQLTLATATTKIQQKIGKAITRGTHKRILFRGNKRKPNTASNERVCWNTVYAVIR